MLKEVLCASDVTSGGHKGKECPRNICAVAGCLNVVNKKRWNDLAGRVRTNEFEIVLDLEPIL